MRENVLSSQLHERILHCAQYARLLSKTHKPSLQELNLTGLHDSAKSLILSMLLHEVKRPIFLVAGDNHQATRYFQEISNLSRLPVLLYPSSEVSPYEQVLSSQDTVASQMEVLQHIASAEDMEQKSYCVILPSRALMQRVLPKDELLANTLELKKGGTVEILELAKKLAALGYSREHLVSLRGEFSVRGDIVDIYPSTGFPVRIEFFDNEVESIRAFNIESQRSIEEIEAVKVPPRYWIVINDPQGLVDRISAHCEKVMPQMSDDAAETLRAVLENEVPMLTQGSYPESAEYYGTFLHDQFATILNYLPQDAILVLDEWDSIALSMNSLEDKLNAALEEGVSTGRFVPIPRPLHLCVSDVVSSSKKLQRIYLSELPIFDSEPAEDSASVIKFNSHGIERMNSQVQVLVDKVRAWRKDGFRVVVSSEQPGRVIDLLREWDIPASYVPGANDRDKRLLDLSNQQSNTDGSDVKTDSQGTLFRLVNNRDEVWVTRYGFYSGFKFDDGHLISITDVEMFGQKRKPTVYRRPVVEKNYDRLTSLAELKPGEYVVHVKQGIAVYTGIQRIKVDNQEREYLCLQYMGDDRLYVPVDQINLLSRFRGTGETAPRLSKLGGAEWESTKRRVKRSVRQAAEDLVNLYAMRAKQEGFAATVDTPWQLEMEEAFPFDETPDQWQAIVDCKKDMESTKPMDRLICGDVGFGKTEVALRCIFKAVMSGKQAVVLVPTTILAQQHFNTLVDRFAAYPVKIGLLSRFRTAKEQKDVVQRLSTGECDVAVGTHRLLQKDIGFKDLGLVVIDEEHRFGVANKEKLKQLRIMVDVITMSATPIPRTLYMALSGTRDMSIINTPPVNRAPIKTYVGEYKSALVRTAILHELERGGQVYVVHNRVETIESVAMAIKELVPEARIAIGHGQMNERELEQVMLDFYAHQMDILVATTIIESGLDISNCNTIIIDEADKLGLAQLYQLRGRVGRSDLQAYCYCLYRQDKSISETAQNRLKAIREFTSLGSGYQIALRDMEIRGVGNVLGAEQHGHMLAVGFDLYCKLLEEAVGEVKGEVVEAEPDAQVDINVTAYIPETYMANTDQKLIEYKRLADVRSERDLVMLTEEWRDRFGPLPVETQQLVKVVKLRLLAYQAGVSSIKPEMQGIRLSVEYRLQIWLPIQAKLPRHLASRTTYKPGSPGGGGPSPYILMKSIDLSPEEQLDVIEELLTAMLSISRSKAS